MAANVPLTESFASHDWSNYTISQDSTSASALGRQGSSTYPWGLQTLRHIDVRSFLNASENWVATPSSSYSAMNVGFVSGLDNWPFLTVSYTSGTLSLTSIVQAIDLTAIGPSTSLQMALPSLPATVNLANSKLELSTDGFNQHILSLPWSSATTVPTPGQDTLVKFDYSLLAGIDLTSVTGVRIKINGSAGAQYRLGALRLTAYKWIQPSVDFDTRNGILRQSVSPTGTADEPLPSNQQVPQVWYTAASGGSDDPQPINGTFEVIFNTGGNTGQNFFSINMRAVGGTDTSQLLLQGLTQAQLSGQQPGLTPSAKIPRRVSDLQGLTMGQMSQSMLNLDAVAEQISLSWTNFTIQWGSNPSVQVGSSLGTSSYSWVGGSLPTFSSYTYYLASICLIDNQIRVKIYPVNQTTLMKATAPIFDTGLITDSYQFIRRPGRVGWQASFGDGAAFIAAIRPASVTFAEYQSAPLNSNTPVSGVQVYSQGSPNSQLWQSFSALAGPSGSPPAISQDTSRTLSGASTKVYATSNGQGVISNVLTTSDGSGITDAANSAISFSIWLPSSAQNNGGSISAYLISETGAQVPLNMPTVVPDHWQPIQFQVPSQLQSGLYQLAVSYTGPATPFWIDSVNVEQRVISWSARANPTAPWVPFNDLINSDTNGIVFPVKGTQLQVRAQAHRQDATLSGSPKIVPRYAQLGKTLWPEDQAAAVDPFGAISAAFTYTVGSGRVLTFTASSPQSYIANYVWSISDGAILNGSSVSHTFSVTAGVNTAYNVTLTVTDYYGNTTFTSQRILVA